MARYVTTVRTQQAAEEAFAYMADLRNFAEWDPGVSKVVQVTGDGAGAGTEFDVTASGATLRYVTTTYDPQNSSSGGAGGELVVVGTSRMFTSTDKVSVISEGDSTMVRYEAVLELNGVLRVVDPLLGLAFGRIGDRAAAGLRRVLAGEDVPV